MNESINTITGVEISYYLICKRKLWYFTHNIQMEHTNENVDIGAVLHETSYKRKQKEIQIGPIKIDFIEKNKALIHEIKKSKAIEEAHIWQLKYYLYYLQSLGVSAKGKIDYPLLRRREDVKLDSEDEKEINLYLAGIEKIKTQKIPPEILNSKICKKCSYYELCYI